MFVTVYVILLVRRTRPNCFDVFAFNQEMQSMISIFVNNLWKCAVCQCYSAIASYGLLMP